ncbi:HIV Tat-specific factor 1 homolog [Oppia nitens]|uniref:HIV Tat-specific factor 1 homolog n=1 Tax=Oppia nitens TaxID=1686743 RepID=UPI0023D9AC70|nr:HIV Tat-specific factor 1 homolog [Oppia nitens]
MDDDFEYQLAQEKAENVAKSQVKTRIDPKDGTEYEWNEPLKAWFPKIDDDFIAKYQSSYGNFTDNSQISEEPGFSGHNLTVTSDNNQPQQTSNNSNDYDLSANVTNNGINKITDNKKPFVSKLLNKRKEEEEKQEWFDVDDEHNTKVYVSNLPLDTTEEEFVELMKKCGYIEKDDMNQFKIKLYKDSNGQLKGDGLCTYLKIESIPLALSILDEYVFKDKTLHVERAKFSLKGDYNPSLKQKRKKKDKQKEKKKIERLLDWRPEKITVERPKSEKTVIIKNMFDPKEFLEEPKLILEYRSDLRDECTEKCGSVKRVDIYDCHPEGVAAIVFNEFEGAEQCVQLMNGRFFAGRRLTACHWDGKTRYKIEETEEEAEKRIKQWDEFLERDN